MAAATPEPDTNRLSLTVTGAVAGAGLEALALLAQRVDQPRSSVSLFDLRIAEVASRLQLSAERRVMEALTNVGATRSVLLLAAVLVVGALFARSVRGAVRCYWWPRSRSAAVL